MSFMLSPAWIFILIAIILAFLFPACLIDAIRLQDEEKAREAREKACLCFGVLVLLLMLILS